MLCGLPSSGNRISGWQLIFRYYLLLRSHLWPRQVICLERYRHEHRMRRIILDFELTKEMRDLMMQIITMRDLAVFLGIQPNAFKNERAEIEGAREKHYFQEINPEVLAGEDLKLSEDEQRACNIAKAYRLIEKGRAEKLSKNLLLKIRSTLSEKLSEEPSDSVFR